jgi:hypothetical protein
LASLAPIAWDTEVRLAGPLHLLLRAGGFFALYSLMKQGALRSVVRRGSVFRLTQSVRWHAGCVSLDPGPMRDTGRQGL